MKVGIIGVGAVGTACAKTMFIEGIGTELILLDVNEARAKGVANDLSYARALFKNAPEVRAGGYEELEGASVIVITAGINEQAGGAVDRDDARGRLLLLPHNAGVYADVVPQVARAAPDAPIVVVTDPPDPLADLALRHTKTNPVLSAGTFLDSQRFCFQIAERLDCSASSVEAMVIGEHGTSQVYVWSAARVGGQAVLELVAEDGIDPASFRADVEQAVRFTNIEIIEGTGASQHSISFVTAAITSSILRDQRLVAPVGVQHPEFGVTLSLPSVIGRRGVSRVFRPTLSPDETEALAASARAIAAALQELDSASERQVVIQPAQRKASEEGASTPTKRR